MILGHKTAPVTLDLYVHLLPDRMDDLAGRMDSAARAFDVPQYNDGAAETPKTPR